MPSKGNGRATVIALCGKGGVGKTSVSAAMVKILASNPDNNVLAIDADPAVGLAVALGFEVEKTVDDIRNDLIKSVLEKSGGDAVDIVSRLDYEMLSALEERDNLAFLAIGRPETEGCYCQVNRILKDIIASMADNFDFVIIDGEAGIEQVNRRVMENVTHLVLVSDGSAKGLQVVKTIGEVAKEAVQYEKSGLILNRLRSAEERGRITLPESLNDWGWIPEDDSIREFDMAGKSILDLPDCPSLEAIADCMKFLY